MKKIVFIIKHFKSAISDVLHIYKLKKTFPTVKFGKSLDIQNIDRVEIGSNTIISNNTTINCGADWSESKGYFKCGKNNYIGPNAVIFAAGGVTFGDNTMIGPGVNIISHQHTYDDVTKSHYEQPSKFSAINIGDNVMIYTNATIAPGVSIGDDAIIGANAFVIKDVETKTMVAGVPAKFIRKLP